MEKDYSLHIQILEKASQEIQAYRLAWINQMISLLKEED